MTATLILCGLVFSAPSRAVGATSPQQCEQRVNDTLAKLEACIRRTALWDRLAHFQRIADAHPGPNGHGNRNTGTAGYKASVAYVAGLMRQAGYNVTIQQYAWRAATIDGAPTFRSQQHSFQFERDWFVARGSAGGNVTAAIQPARGSGSGCSAGDFTTFTRGNIALLELADCAPDTQVANAQNAGAAAVVLYNPDGGSFEVRLTEPTNISVVGAASHDVGAELSRQYTAGDSRTVHIDVRTRIKSGIDYNLIADSPFGDANHLVVIDAHLDSIYGAGMLDNASGSTTILEIALNLAKTPTRNRLRYIWFGGEELGLLGSHYYTKHLTPAELGQIAFDVDVDVTATPNFDFLVADPAFAHNARRFPANVVPQSGIGNEYFADFFQQGGVISRPARFGNDGTDSNAFSLVGIPNSGILTQQDCCKRKWETALWGGFLGNYEGDIPSHDGGCVDNPRRWCDNLSNNDPFVLELASKATAYVTFKLANRPFP